MPVKRLPGPRGQVRALAPEIDAWRSVAGEVEVEAPEAAPEFVPGVVAEPTRRGGWWKWAVALVVMLCGIGMGAMWVLRPSLADVTVTADGVAGLDRNGKEIWRRVYGALNSESYHLMEQKFWMGDLDGDGQREVLFIPLVSNWRSIPLVCLNEDGTERWRFEPGDGSGALFMARQFLVQGKDVILTSHHNLKDPVQIVRLDVRGKKLAEYRHRGHLHALREVETELGRLVAAGGVSDVEQVAELVLLDPLRLEERARWHFGRSWLRDEHPYNFVFRIDGEGKQWLVHVHDRPTKSELSVVYRFVGLRALSAEPSDLMLAAHREKTGRGMTEAERAALLALAKRVK
ncbi:MAG: hypothetical protein U0R19_14540 [Bryobacteraceae bacterium]